MPRFILFCYLTMPFVIGVSFTLAFPSFNTRSHNYLVYVVAAIWAALAYGLQTYLKAERRVHWPREWVLSSVIAPLFAAFAVSLWNDDAIMANLAQHRETNLRDVSEHRGQAAPRNSMLTGSQSREFFADVQPRLVRFAVQLVTSLPPLWWLLALAISLWKRSR